MPSITLGTLFEGKRASTHTWTNAYCTENRRAFSRVEDECGWAQDTPEVRHQGAVRMSFSWWETFYHLFSSLGVGGGILG